MIVSQWPVCPSALAYFPELQPWVGNQRPAGGNYNNNQGNAYQARIAAEAARIDAANAANERGNQALNEGRFEDAVREFREQIRQDPGFSGGYEGLAIAYIDNDDFDDAVDMLQRAYDHGMSLSTWRSQTSYIHRRKANTLLDAGNYAGAEAELRTAIGLTKKNAWTWDALGIALENEGKYAEAEAAYKKAVHYEDNPQYQNHLANFERNQSRVVSAQDLHQNIQSFVQTLNTVAPAGLTLDGGTQIGVAFGVPFSQSGLSSIPDPVPANNPETRADVQLFAAVDAAAVATPADNKGVHPEALTVPFDVGGETATRTLTFPQAPTLDPATWPEAVKSDQRMVEAWNHLKDLKATGAKLDADLEQLVVQRDREKDPARVKALTLQVDQKTQEKQVNLVAITQGEEKVKTIRHLIQLEEDSPPPAPATATQAANGPSLEKTAGTPANDSKAKNPGTQ